MQIQIHTLLQAYSHQAGTMCLLPGSTFAVKIFPMHLIFFQADVYPIKQMAYCSFELQGPIKEFTALQNLEKGCIDVFGFAKQGYFLYRLFAMQQSQGISIRFDRLQFAELGFSMHIVDASMRLQRKEQTQTIRKKDVLSLCKSNAISCTPPVPVFNTLPKLSLGCHKAPCWDRIVQRQDLHQILPLWCRLSSFLPQQQYLSPSLPAEGVGALLHQCATLRAQKDKEPLAQSLLHLFNLSFNTMLMPQLQDFHHLGFGLPPLQNAGNISILHFLQQSSQLLWSFFIQETKQGVDIMPCVLPQMDCGKITNFPTQYGTWSLEWTKKQIRRMSFTSIITMPLSIHLPPSLRRCRIRQHEKDRGHIILCPITIATAANTTYWFDHFEK